MMEALKDYLLDLRLVTGTAATAAFYVSAALVPLLPGWRVAKRVKKGGANRLPTVVVGGAVSAGLAAAALAVFWSLDTFNDPAPDVRWLWPMALAAALAFGLVVLWPAYSVLLHLILRRRPSELPKLDGP